MAVTSRIRSTSRASLHLDEIDLSYALPAVEEDVPGVQRDLDRSGHAVGTARIRG